jgi:hypothetical protein
MDASTRILRGLVVAEWALALAAAAAGFWLWDALPPALRDYEPPEPELFGSIVPALGVAFLLLPLALAASFGVLVLWRPARWLYAATHVVGVAIGPLFGPAVQPAWVGPLYDLGTLCGGGALALLYLSPAARHFGATPRTPAEAAPPPAAQLSRLALFGGGLAVGVLAATGALVLASVGFGYGALRASESEEAEGRRFGASARDAACLDEARRRVRTAGSASFGIGTPFLSGCLSTAESTDAFCRDVPAYETSQSWPATGCEGDPLFHDCQALLETVQEHCHASREAL